MPPRVPTAAPRRLRWPVLAASLLCALPVLLVTWPPMVDYPQHLAMASVIRFYGDAARGFADNFVITWWRPHGAWELLVASLAWVLPLHLAGKAVVGLSLAALGPAALGVLRRRGADGWWGWALAVLACGYGYSFWFGFVGSLLGYPLFLAGVALADRVLSGSDGVLLRPRRGLGSGERRTLLGLREGGRAPRRSPHATGVGLRTSPRCAGSDVPGPEPPPLQDAARGDKRHGGPEGPEVGEDRAPGDVEGVEPPQDGGGWGLEDGEEPLAEHGSGGWGGVVALGLVGVLFYAVHLQFLLLLFGAVGWLTICRWAAGEGWRWRGLLALLPGVGLATAALGWARFAVPAAELSALEQAVRATPAAWNGLFAKLYAVTGLTFGIHRDGSELVATVLLVVLVALSLALRRRATAGGDGSPISRFARCGGALQRHRFAGLAAALFVVYLALPEWAAGYLVAGRVAPLAVIVGLCALPAPRPERRRLAVFLAAALLVFQLAVVSLDFAVFQREAAGFAEVLDGVEPGRDLLGLIFEPTSSRVPAFPVYAHFPAYYQAFHGGRVLVSMADFFHTPVAYRPGRDWGTLPVLLSERNPQDFDLAVHGPRFDLFLLRGDAALLSRLFGRDAGRFEVREAGRWWLLRRREAQAGKARREGALQAAPPLAH